MVTAASESNLEYANTAVLFVESLLSKMFG